MGEISQDIGQRIRSFRKARSMTLEELSAVVGKNKSTLSKYEAGEIIMDIETIYEIARALGIHVEQLLCATQERVAIRDGNQMSAFFNGLTQFYAYYYDGRYNRIVRCVFDVLLMPEDHRYKIMMYMNFADYDRYQNCEIAFWGYMEHYDSVTNFTLTNQASSMEQCFIQVPATYTNSDQKWGLLTGLSSRPLMPVSLKMLFSRKRMTENEAMEQMLRFTKEDVRLMKFYNMLTVL